MGRIIVQTKITNLFEEDKFIRSEMLVDTRAGALILPMAWKQRLGKFKRTDAVELQLANQEVLRGEACWPVEIRIDGFRPVANEVVFVDMGSEDDGEFEPLLGYVILEQAQAAVDMIGHRLVPVKYIDMKSMRRGDFAPSVTYRHDTTHSLPVAQVSTDNAGGAIAVHVDGYPGPGRGRSAAIAG